MKGIQGISIDKQKGAKVGKIIALSVEDLDAALLANQEKVMLNV